MWPCIWESEPKGRKKSQRFDVVIKVDMHIYDLATFHRELNSQLIVLSYF